MVDWDFEMPTGGDEFGEFAKRVPYAHYTQLGVVPLGAPLERHPELHTGPFDVDRAAPGNAAYHYAVTAVARYDQPRGHQREMARTR